MPGAQERHPHGLAGPEAGGSRAPVDGGLGDIGRKGEGRRRGGAGPKSEEGLGEVDACVLADHALGLLDDDVWLVRGADYAVQAACSLGWRDAGMMLRVARSAKARATMMSASSIGARATLSRVQGAEGHLTQPQWQRGC